MANNTARWVGNIDGASEPYVRLGKFQAGGTQAIVIGELLEFTGDTNTAWVPIDSDFDMDSNIAIAAEEVKAGDLAGYYRIYVPRPGDMWEFDLASASALAEGTAMTYSSSTAVTTGGTHAIGYSIGQAHYPQRQFHLSDGQIGDNGTTIRSTSTVIMCIEASHSVYSKFVV